MPFADPECLVGVLVESVQDGLVGGGRLGWIGFVSGRREFGDDLPGGGQVGEARYSGSTMRATSSAARRGPRTVMGTKEHLATLVEAGPERLTSNQIAAG
ncbi:hypothetical protein [Streptomyces vastus]|uniref:Uncharacterized protein n=1 Tax=Streptomyces vastus TaxID=285451 RepID=A0ABP6ED91_9ACTN